MTDSPAPVSSTTALSSEAQPLVHVSGLSKRFSETLALDALDLALYPGEVVGLLGPNGAGKTTTLKVLLGLLKPSQGHASILGLDCTRDSQRVKQSIGFMPDEPQFYDFLSGHETLDFVISVRGLDPVSAWSNLEELVQILDFAPQLAALTATYSHGMKKKLALLCALLHRPRVLLLDEPTNGLDPPTALRVRELLRREAARGAAVLLSTHLLDMADRMCDRMWIINRGRTIALGSSAEVRTQAGRGKILLVTFSAALIFTVVSLELYLSVRIREPALLMAMGMMVYLGSIQAIALAGRAARSDSVARPFLSALPLTPHQVLDGKATVLRSLLIPVFCALVYVAFMALRAHAADLVMRALLATLALYCAVAGAVAIAFMSSGVGVAGVAGGQAGSSFSTQLLLMPLMVTVFAPDSWVASVSLLAVAAVTWEAQRAARHSIRWIDDPDDHAERETSVWRALLAATVFFST